MLYKSFSVLLNKLTKTTANFRSDDEPQVVQMK